MTKVSAKKDFRLYLKEVQPKMRCQGFKNLSTKAKFKCGICKKTTTETPNSLIARGGCCNVVSEQFEFTRGIITCNDCKTSWHTQPFIASAYKECPICSGEGTVNVVFRKGTTVIERWFMPIRKSVFLVLDEIDWSLIKAFSEQVKAQGFKSILKKSSGEKYTGLYDKDLIDKWFNSSLTTLRILGIDPGSSNFAWTVIEVSRPFKVKIIATGMLNNPIKGIVGEFRQPLNLYKGEILKIVNEYAPDIVGIERFMTRGIKGVTIELINIMIGVIIALDVNCRLITAAQWKNEWNKNGNLEEFYTKVDVTVHQADSLGIALYIGYTLFKEKPFSNLKSIQKLLVKQLRGV